MDKRAFEYVKKFISLLKRHIKIESAYFFGSRTTNDYLKYSDIDLIIVSCEFEGIPFYERAVKIYQYWDFDYSLEVFCYTPKEFEKKKKQISIVAHAIKNGIRLI